MSRSLRADVRNPLTDLVGFQVIKTLDASTRLYLKAGLDDLRRDAKARADKAWSTGKAPMALYWKCLAVYAGHISRLIRPSSVAQARKAEALAMSACRELIDGGGTAESLQQTINLARKALGRPTW